MLKFALAGNPNSGKTTLFNLLTGATAYVGNWPGVTVEKREGVYKQCAQPITVVDLPGIYSLSPYTPEEVITRNFILDEKPDCVINIVDATNLERNLYLTTQIMEIDVPVIVALNMIDAVEKTGGRIDADYLSESIGLPVAPISALKGKGIDELMEKACRAALNKREGTTVLETSPLGGLIEEVRDALTRSGVGNALFRAVKLIEGDDLEVEEHSDALKIVREFEQSFKNETFGCDFEALIADARYRDISARFSPAYEAKEASAGALTRSDKADRVLTHRVFGIPIFLLILFAIFHLTFSENLLFLGGALPDGWISLPGTPFEGIFGEGGINSPGVVLFGLVELGTGSLSAVIGAALESAPAWVGGFIVDGVLGGLFAVLTFVPQILLLFLFFSILEDSGYMARIAFILDRIFRRFGLSGRAFMPMIMGFGCSVPAMVNTRTLSDENERTATIRVIPFFSCGAKLPILTAISGAIVLQFGVDNADFITYGMYLLGIAAAIVSVRVMRRTTLRGATPPFIMELPAYHAPRVKSLALQLWDKLKHFVQKAFTIILASTIVLWTASHFGFGWNFLPDEQIGDSILAGIGKLLQPLFTPLGFGSQLSGAGWVFVVAAFTGLIAKENVVAAFGTLAAAVTVGFEGDGEGIAAVARMIAATGIGVPGLISFIAFNMTTIPCFAAVAAARAELPKNRFRTTIFFWLAASYLIGTTIYLIGSWWWTVFIAAGIAAAAAAAVMIFNRKRANGAKEL